MYMQSQATTQTGKSVKRLKKISNVQGLQSQTIQNLVVYLYDHANAKTGHKLNRQTYKSFKKISWL